MHQHDAIRVGQFIDDFLYALNRCAQHTRHNFKRLTIFQHAVARDTNGQGIATYILLIYNFTVHFLPDVSFLNPLYTLHVTSIRVDG